MIILVPRKLDVQIRESTTDRKQERLGERGALGRIAGCSGDHSLEARDLRHLKKPTQKIMMPMPRVAADTETFTVWMGDSPGAAT